MLDTIFKALYETLTLQHTGLIIGSLLIAGHLVALLLPAPTSAWLRALPRSQTVGSVLLTLAAGWAWLVVSKIDLGEFYTVRSLAQWAIPIIYLLMLFVVNDFLGARSLGILVLLAVGPFLNAAFLKDPQSRILVSGICYLWLTAALFWIGMPYTLRNQITLATATPTRFKFLSLAGLVAGGLFIFASLAWWPGY